MNIILWILQTILAAKLLASAYSHAVRPDSAKMQRGLQRLGAAARPLLALSGSSMILGGVCLILPGTLGLWLWLTPWTAAALAALMLVGVAFHAGCRDRPNVWIGFVLSAMAAFVAAGRLVLAPL